MNDLVPVRGATNVLNQYKDRGSKREYCRNYSFSISLGAQNYPAANHYPLPRPNIL